MSDEIYAGSPIDASTPSARGPVRTFVPMQVGEATVYVERIGTATVETSDEIYAATPVAQQAFEEAGTVIEECVRTIGTRIRGIAEVSLPSKLAVEFTVSFEAVGKTQIIPFLVTGETKVTTGLKVTAEWEREKPARPAAATPTAPINGVEG